MSLSIQRADLIRNANYIAGEWQAAAGAQLDVTDPATGNLIARVPDSGAAQARAALDAAHAAFPAWRKVPAKQRAQIIKRWNDLVLAHQDDLGALISLEQGKPLAEGKGEVAYAASYIEWFGEEATRMNGETIPAPVPGRRMFALREPVGVVAAITPWNFPAAMIARKIAPALAAGCTVVCKPAEDTPLTSLALVRLTQEAGVPPGVLNIVTASRERTPEVVDVWLDDARVRKITFTGSTPVGKHLARRSADTLKKLSLELGGNAPFIVFDDADIDAAVDGFMAAKFRNGGQTCVSPNRVFVHDAVHDAFAAKLAARVAALKVGPASDPASQIGPMINARAVEKIDRHVRDAIGKGARLMAGGERLTQLGPNYYAPTVLTGADATMACACEETFGPVAPLTRFSNEAEVVAAANDTPFGLAAYFYSQDVRRIWRVAEALETGIVGINEGALAAEAAPFGGVKESGYGREGSVHGLDDYLHIKYVCQGQLD
ncbi:NAD-dependent succinate-semialdehyde dehydrogenase [Ralstonia mannitolilytica]|uniref:Succinate-semialdehyde dehydrogenase [NADP(+)] GabD n=1 Tax=Ralstonia mannitolilytica TaxID=105219 RepID=A0AAJ4ZKC9_9RALS|nr:NAD-dependent succinate-semialdehyde dehydrogenase [Ralstonia mannitolilytica]AJW45509.1 succinate-semialdehyde dehydrogenase [Ralstonia mannitolilytica]MBU9579499.1 NAD-dependent succinate-semialdehyde dehydrogenase [Ralstonia mannitolilytica]QIF07722.1 NAD-dependent succinate-semialdehyde dehydrogenase [Ralstonia mannitolilytica]CAG2150310.1 Succinate-semialdehyde dehydrogenase [NADP(+)] GabD [Ralstonia mannitolilytica]CAJ0723784.1 Succinate-semialdehyde dehydrogenase [NADP(+)] GabD [Rals